MSITEELREFIDSLACHKDTRDMMRRIADRIDKEHAEAVADALQLRGEPDRWVELPVDADGVPIHVGDEVEFFNGNHDHVRLLALTKSGWSVNSLEWNPASLHHVKPDSWERKNKEHVISHATVEVTPHIDWSRMADELDEFVEIVRGMAGERG